MDRLIDIAAARSLVADAALWPRVRDFLWDFAPSIHPSWLEEVESLKMKGFNPQAIKLSNYQTIKLTLKLTIKLSNYQTKWTKTRDSSC